MGCNVKKIIRYQNRIENNNNNNSTTTCNIIRNAHFHYFIVTIVIILLFGINYIQYDEIVPTTADKNNNNNSRQNNNSLLLFASSFVLQQHQSTLLKSLQRQCNQQNRMTIPFLHQKKYIPRRLFHHQHVSSSSNALSLSSSDTDADTTTNTIATTGNTASISRRIDPTVANWIMMIEGELDNDADDTKDTIQSTPTYIRMSISEIQQASVGISIWKDTLLKGRLPTSNDFRTSIVDDELQVTNTNHNNNNNKWPNDDDPLLWDIIINSMIEIQLPRFILYHPQVINIVLRNIIQICIQYKYTKQKQKHEKQLLLQSSNDNVDDDDYYYYNYYDSYDEYEYNENNITLIEGTDGDTFADDIQLSVDEMKRIANDIVTEKLTKQWGAVVRGVQSLDQLFGIDHGLLNDDNENDNNNKSNNTIGFGLNDGIWEHSGWKIIQSLQQEISSIPELRTLIQQLGRRPTAENTYNNKKKNSKQPKLEKFIPRQYNKNGVLGAIYDTTTRTSIRGITVGGTLSDMLPSEALLLLESRNDNERQSLFDEKQLENKLNNSNCTESLSSIGKSKSVSSSALRRLFLAKLVENKLLSYDSIGYKDIASVQKPNTRYLERLPSGPGGPIYICLDTSWSMSGRREFLSKAIVIACVKDAVQIQHRDVQIISFSSKNNIMSSGLISSNTYGIKNLLEFLSSSFGGGTDVTAALRHAITSIDTTIEVSSTKTTPISMIDDNKTTGGQHLKLKSKYDNKRMLSNSNSNNNSFNRMAAADIVLVTDGEISDPPISNELMIKLDQLKHRANVQVHGILVGKKESIPLSKLCTHIHTFLVDYETNQLNSLITTKTTKSSSSFSKQPSAASPSSPPTTNYKYDATTALRSIRAVEYHHNCYIGMDRKQLFGRNGLNGRLRLKALLAKYADDDDDDYSSSRNDRRNNNRQSPKPPMGGKKLGRYKVSTNENDKDDLALKKNDATTTTIDDNNDGDASSVGKTKESSIDTRLQSELSMLRSQVKGAVANDEWKVTHLDKEKESELSCWRFRNQLDKAIECVADGLIERDEEARLVVLGMVSEENVIFLGTPGTAKSVLGRRLAQLCGGTFFQRLLTRFTTPEEIFGPLSLRALENDEYKRKIDGYLPTATVAFLDELFKANSAILNTLLTILNERQFDNGAGGRIDCPIRCVVGASNELPESDELDALYDRFLLRKEVKQVSDDGLITLLTMSLPGISSRGSNGDTYDTVFTDDLDVWIPSISRAADKVELDNDICLLIQALRSFMRDELDVDVSDRRLVKAARLLKVSAACHGRNKVDYLDCLLLQHVMWRFPEQRASIREWLWNNLLPGSTVSPTSAISTTTTVDESLQSAAVTYVRQYRFLLNCLRNDAIAAVRKTLGIINEIDGGRSADVLLIQSIVQEVDRLSTLLQQRSNSLARHIELLRRAEDHLWLGPDEAIAAQQLLLPKAIQYMNRNNIVLEDAMSLKVSLTDYENVSNECRLELIELLWDEDDDDEPITFSDEALALTLREAKARYDAETFRKWKRARKKLDN